MATTTRVQHLKGLSDVFGGTSGSPYKAVLLDQFGVLHDGRKPYPGAIEAARQLHAAGLRLYIISNSSRRSSGTIAKLAKLGFDASWFEGAITSGELAHTCLTARPDDWWRGLGSRAVHLTWAERGAISLDGLGLQVVGEYVSQADFLLAHGTEAVGVADDGTSQPALPRSLDQLNALLAAAAALPSPPPMIVANPDLVTVDGGGLVTMPGTLAATYASLGGRVELMGKPAPRVYSACLGALRLAPQQVIAIGDSIEHDIGGAASAGIDSVLVAGGIHADVLLGTGAAAAPGAGAPVQEAGLVALAAQHGVSPQYTVPFFSW